MSGWNKEGVIFSCSLSLPQTFNKKIRKLIVNALKFSIIVIKIFPGCTSRFTIIRYHNCSPNSFPFLFIKILKQFFHDIVSYRLLFSQARHGKAMKFLTPTHNSITLLGDQQVTTKSFRSAITATLVACFTKVFNI